MHCIEILEFKHLHDIFRFITEGKHIDIIFLGSSNSSSWEHNDELFLSFRYFSDNYVMDYECVLDKESKKIKSLKIFNITLIEGCSDNEN